MKTCVKFLWSFQSLHIMTIAGLLEKPNFLACSGLKDFLGGRNFHSKTREILDILVTLPGGSTKEHLLWDGMWFSNAWCANPHSSTSEYDLIWR